MDPSDRVSQEARRIEMEAIQELIRDGVFQRLDRPYKRGSFMQCIYDPMRCHYLITLHHTREGKKFAVTVTINEEDFLTQSSDLRTWKTTLRGLAMALAAKLRSDMRSAGLHVVEPGEEYEARGRAVGPLSQDIQNIYEAGIDRPHKIRNQLGWVDEIADFECTCGGKSFGHLQSCPKFQAEQEAKEEAEAVESIKRTLAEQAGSSEEP